MLPQALAAQVSSLSVLPSSFGICSALVYPRPPQAPMIKSSSLTGAHSPPPHPRQQGEWGVRSSRSRRVSPFPPRPRHPLRDFTKPGETPAAEPGEGQPPGRSSAARTPQPSRAALQGENPGSEARSRPGSPTLRSSSGRRSPGPGVGGHRLSIHHKLLKLVQRPAAR